MLRLSISSPSPVVRTVVDLPDVLLPADGGADVGINGDRELVACLEPVCHTLGLLSSKSGQNTKYKTGLLGELRCWHTAGRSPWNFEDCSLDSHPSTEM